MRISTVKRHVLLVGDHTGKTNLHSARTDVQGPELQWQRGHSPDYTSMYQNDSFILWQEKILL